MGMSVARGAREGRRGRHRRSSSNNQPVSEINVTPLVDVMLVLLIVFMVSAPLMTLGVPINLPKTAAQSLQPEKKPVMVSVSPEGEIFVGKDIIAQDILVATIDALAAEGKQERIYVRGNTATQYGVVMKVMGALSAAGYAHIGLITTQEKPE